MQEIQRVVWQDAGGQPVRGQPVQPARAGWATAAATTTDTSGGQEAGKSPLGWLKFFNFANQNEEACDVLTRRAESSFSEAQCFNLLRCSNLYKA